MKGLYIFIVVTLAVISQRCYGEDVEERIYHGKNAISGQFPYQALLKLYVNETSTGNCGGSLISRTIVLTAAHCVYGVKAVKVTLGVTKVDDLSNAVEFTVDFDTNVRYHPNFNKDTLVNDIALIELPEKVNLTRFIQTVALPKLAWSNPDYFVNYIVTASGFGQTYNDEDTPHPTLKFANEIVMAFKRCKRVMDNTINKVSDGMLCTFRNRNAAGTCPGDSGGPLVIRLQSGLYLIGADSWGDTVCESNIPDVFTNVAYYLRWINEMTNIPIS